MTVSYQSGIRPDTDAFIELYRASTLGARRPLDDRSIVEQMIAHSDVLITAWDGELLVGLARSLTDYGYVAYLADLVVRETYQHGGIGTELIKRTQEQLGARSKIVLLAAPEATAYYPRIGFKPLDCAWMIGARDTLAPD